MQETQETKVKSLGWENQLEKGMAIHFFPGKSHGLWSLVGYSPWDHKESDMIEHTCTHIHQQQEHS